MERFVAWLVGLKPATVYLAIGISTFVENVFPPTPSDAAVALGGFLTQQGRVSPVTVWLVGWLANLAGAIGVYLLARRFGRGFMASRLGRRLLPPDAVVGLEREYLRFGMAGIFLSRFLPGFRSFVAPFVGLVNLRFWTAFLPMALASGIWYAVLVWAGARLGAEWDAINRFVSQMNRTLAGIALTILAAGIIWAVRRSRARPLRRDRLLRAVHRALGSTLEAPAEMTGDPAAAGAAALLFELADADRQITPAERTLITEYLRSRWGLGAEEGEVVRGTRAGRPSETTMEMAAAAAHGYDHARRLELMTQLYRIARSDGTLSSHEERLMERAATLLGLSPEDLVRVRERLAP